MRAERDERAGFHDPFVLSKLQRGNEVPLSKLQRGTSATVSNGAAVSKDGAWRARAIASSVAFVLSMGCSGATDNGLRPASPEGSGIADGHLETQWADRALSDATLELHRVFTREGSEGLLRLRLRPDDVNAMFSPEGRQRIDRLPTGLAPAPGERRWQVFRAFADAPVLGFCARGAHVAEPNGPEGLRQRGLVIDRLLIVGGEREGYWGAWVEGVVLTTNGWRLMPTIPFDRQVETPRRDHSDVQLWECDLGRRPDREHPLTASSSGSP